MKLLFYSNGKPSNFHVRVYSSYMLLCVDVIQINYYRYFWLLESQTEKGTSSPFILIDNHDIIVEDGVVHHEGDACEIA